MEEVTRIGQASTTERVGIFVRMELMKTEKHQNQYRPLQPYMEESAIVDRSRAWKQRGGEAKEARKKREVIMMKEEEEEEEEEEVVVVVVVVVEVVDETEEVEEAEEVEEVEEVDREVEEEQRVDQY
ncbi:hypothetical protein SLS57_012064 [Botryosphaeria dothidea]